MSSLPVILDTRPMTLPRLLDKREAGEPIVMVTAYDFPSALTAERAGAANTVLGYDSTVPISVDELLMLAAAVRRGLRTPLLVGDLPFGSYEISDAQAIATAQRFVKEAGCDAIKLEGGGVNAERARALDLAKDALDLQDAGCFSVVFEAIPSEVAAVISSRMRVPVIGIGAGPAVDGQVLVFHDLLGIREGHGARFVKRYADLLDDMVDGVAAYAADVRSRAYPGPEHSYSVDGEELSAFRAAVEELAG